MLLVLQFYSIKNAENLFKRIPCHCNILYCTCSGAYDLSNIITINLFCLQKHVHIFRLEINGKAKTAINLHETLVRLEDRLEHSVTRFSFYEYKVSKQTFFITIQPQYTYLISRARVKGLDNKIAAGDH